MSQIYHFMYWRDKNTKNLPIHGYPGRLLDFKNSEGRILQGAKGEIPGVETPVGAMLWDI